MPRDAVSRTANFGTVGKNGLSPHQIITFISVMYGFPFRFKLNVMHDSTENIPSSYVPQIKSSIFCVIIFSLI